MYTMSFWGMICLLHSDSVHSTGRKNMEKKKSETFTLKDCRNNVNNITNNVKYIGKTKKIKNYLTAK